MNKYEGHMNSNYDRLLHEMEEEISGYNDAVYEVIAQDLEDLADNLSDEYYFTPDARSGDAAQDVYDWVRVHKPEVMKMWLSDPEAVIGHDAVWSSLESLKRVEPWYNVSEEDALGMDVRDYERWKAYQRTEESCVCEGKASVRKNYLETDKISQEVFDALQEADPTDKKKYMDWMAKQVDNRSDVFGNDEQIIDFVKAIGGVVKNFDDKLERGLIPKDKRDINSFAETGELVDLMNSLSNVKSKTQQKKRVKERGAVRILDDDFFSVYEIHTFDAAQFYGKGTKWCITGIGYGDKYWNDYSSDGMYFYFVILKQDVWMSPNLGQTTVGDDGEEKAAPILGGEGEKFAMVFDDGVLKEVFDENDETISNEMAGWLEDELIDRGAEFASFQPSEVEDGYDEDGYDRDGYDRVGYDEGGYDRDGYDRDGYDMEGYNRDGYNEGGYDVYGYDEEGYDEEGYDEGGYDRDGYDRDGYDMGGYNRDGYNEGGYDEEGRKRRDIPGQKKFASASERKLLDEMIEILK